jgi:hypothetical protein
MHTCLDFDSPIVFTRSKKSLDRWEEDIPLDRVQQKSTKYNSRCEKKRKYGIVILPGDANPKSSVDIRTRFNLFRFPCLYLVFFVFFYFS